MRRTTVPSRVEGPEVPKDRTQLWTDGTYLSLYSDGTIGISDGVGYVGTLEKREVEKLQKALQLAARVGGFAICYWCGEVFTPSRVPDIKRRSFCQPCRSKKRPILVAARNYHIRKGRR